MAFFSLNKLTLPVTKEAIYLFIHLIHENPVP